MDSTHHFSKLITALFFLLCMCGLMWQVVMISELFFAYSVTTRIRIGVPSVLEPVATSYCSRFTDLLNFDHLNKVTGRNWSYSYLGPDIQKYQNELTVREIFAFTPAENETIRQVIFRKNNSYDSITVSGNEVYHHFEVMKYVYLEHICYRIRIRETDNHSYGYYAVTPTSPGMLYEVYLSDALRKSDPIKISMHQQHTLPFRSLKLDPVIWRQYWDVTKKAKYNGFKSFQIRLISNLLPAPYVTDCFDYMPAFASDAECVQRCVLKRSLDELDLVPFSALITNSTIDKTMVSVIRMRNSSLVQRLLRIERECSGRGCHRKQCNMTTSMTSTQVIEADDMHLQMIAPTQPWIIVSSSPSLTLIEFLTYVMSSIATWSGVSVMSVSPAHLFKWRKSGSMWRRRKRDDVVIMKSDSPDGCVSINSRTVIKF